MVAHFKWESNVKMHGGYRHDFLQHCSLLRLWLLAVAAIAAASVPGCCRRCCWFCFCCVPLYWTAQAVVHGLKWH